MEIRVLQEAGFEWACLGMSYSYKDRKISLDEWWNDDRKLKAFARAYKLADKDGGHNKFLESMMVWFHVEATRSFWQEMDTYRVGVSKQSESTMHTLGKRPPEPCDFETYTDERVINAFISVWHDHHNDIMTLKESLPEGFLQSRVICTNYKALRNVINQRNGHRYKWWGTFVNCMRDQLEHPDLVFGQ